MYSICYSSTASKNLSKNDIEALFNECAIDNEINHISGILLYDNGNIIQVLEGKEEDVKHLFTKIKYDSRHHSIHLIFSEKVPFSIFSGYKTTFTPLRTQEDIIEMHYYLKLLQEIDLTTKITGIVDNLLVSASRI